MIIEWEVYDQFYDIVLNKFIERELGGKTNKTGEAVWREQRDDKFISLQVFKGKSQDPALFYRKRTAFRTNPNATFDKEFHVNGLRYIGIIPPDDMTDFESLTHEQQFWILWGEFKKSLSKKIIPTPPINGFHLNFKSKTRNAIISGNSQTDMSSDVATAKNIITQFYSFISTRKPGNAWLLLSPEYQESSPWENSEERFKTGFVNLDFISKLIFIDYKEIKENTGIEICWTIFIVSKMHIYPVKEINYISNLTIKDLASFSDHIKHMEKRLSSRGLTGLENIEINKLFDPAAPDYLWYALQYDHKKLPDLFGSKRKSKSITRLYEISCKYYKKSLLISGIKAIGQSTMGNK